MFLLLSNVIAEISPNPGVFSSKSLPRADNQNGIAGKREGQGGMKPLSYYDTVVMTTDSQERISIVSTILTRLRCCEFDSST